MGELIMDVHEIAAMKSGLKRRKKKKETVEKWIKRLEELADRIEELEVDYIIIGDERGYVIERKTLLDMLGSIRGGHGKQAGRFWSQLRRVKLVAEELSKEYDMKVVPMVIIEGNLFARYKARYGRMSKVQWFGIQTAIAETGVHLIRTWSLEETILLLEQLKKRSGRKVRMAGLNIKKSLRTEKEEAIHMLYAVSGVGLEKAVSILEKYGSVKAVVNLDEDELIRSLGRKTGQHFYKVVNKDFSKVRRLDEYE